MCSLEIGLNGGLQMKETKRHQLLWKIVYYPVMLFMRLRFGYRPKVQPVEAPALIVSNHVTDIDPLMLALTVRNFTYFIASEHVFRHPLAGKLLIWAMSPISRMKGSTAGDTAITALRRMKKGFSVALFAEGNRTFNGVTADIVESTAKLAKVSGASLVTHRFRGGYLTSPRWAGADMRKGLLTGEIVHIYSPEELKKMTPAQIAEAIRADIHEDAYATQARWQIPYRGKNLAQHLERALCLCPVCGQLGRLKSRGDELTCACGLRAVYTPLGYLEGTGLPFSTVTEWDRWQAQELLTRTRTAGREPIASDGDVTVFELGEDGTETSLGVGTLTVYADRFQWGDQVLPFGDVTGAGLTGPQTLTLTVGGGRSLVFRRDGVCSMRKYVTVYHAATAPEKLLSV